MPVSVEAEGIQEMLEILETLRAIGSTLNGAKLRNIKRVDSTPTMGPRQQVETKNSEVLRYLMESGRDFVSAVPETIADMAEEFAKEVEFRMAKFAKTRTAKKLGVSNAYEYAALAKIGYADKEKVERLANEIAGAALKAAIYVWMRDIEERINKQEPVDGVLTPLSDGYATWKRNVFGFETPIGKASGQLLENLDASGAGARSVVISKDREVSVADQLGKAIRSETSKFVKSKTRTVRKAAKVVSR